ncbi:MAG: aminopeptidase P family protein [Oscillatoria sp. SIO1A7]|nr:aminopeptidase P family protein [Oscillatoria sp. SIO1A7]
MQIPTNPSNSLATALRQRRENLAGSIDMPVILWSGKRKERNAGSPFPFRASSHFLYFAGLPLEDAAIRLEGGKLELYMDDPNPKGILWHGEMPSRDQIARAIGADAAFPKQELQERSPLESTATIPLQDRAVVWEQNQILNRERPTELDRDLAKAIAAIRLCHDDAALAELLQAAACTVQAHYAGMVSTRNANTEAMVRGAMEGVIIANNMQCAYNSIVTVRGEVLHNDIHHHPLKSGDLLLADVGAETQSGWAADVTRTWPVSGKLSPTQREIYNLVLAAQKTCIAKVRAGVEYRDIHLLACRTIAEGLVALGILRGNPEDLVEMDAHALFFPHGVGHLLGLDVHDMEDLGDIAGYEESRVRSDRFGLCFLRLDRPLRPRMLVTIEPGFYQVPAILNDRANREKYQEVVNWDLLAKFADVRGIRIEDDVLVTEAGSEVLTAALPKEPNDIEQLLG